ncbi:hypothetical protein AXK11_02395 [Cephaloticoccus primus]|uniref:Helix-turn-helix domain-containing protein n=1 Tax=Cephaloticoccus primus TaxID=1548207 RepID=A0A139SS80_9BACT|nr:helix-turn-helix domain-containing protein [Cephaloticoccus primus]KXU37455.1 hypothetical protein AXK11_02395 [Cephaloticoccus primus]
MIDNKLKKLNAARAKVAALEQAIANERLKELAVLPAKYGFADADSFIKALKSALGSAKVGRGVAAATRAPGAKRKNITPEAKAKVIELLNAGQTGSEVAAKVGISLPSVQKIKKEFGLVKPRGSKEQSSGAESQAPETQPEQAAPQEQQQPQY